MLQVGDFPSFPFMNNVPYPRVSNTGLPRFDIFMEEIMARRSATQRNGDVATASLIEDWIDGTEPRA